MIGSSRSIRFCLLSSVLVAGGCAAPILGRRPFGEPQVPDVHPQRQARAEKAIREFDDRRHQALLLAARNALRQGDHQTCRDSLDRILEREPNQREALRMSAELALETDRPEEAVTVLRRALALRPADVETAYLLGVALTADDKAAEALPYFQQAATAAPRNREYALALADVERQLTSTEEPLAPPEAEVPRASSAVPTTVAAVVDPAAAPERDENFARILAAWEAGRDVDCARQLAAFLKERPTHVEANILQAEIDLAAGRREMALRRMDRLVVHYPHDMQVRHACGLVNEAAGEAVKAAAFFAEAEAIAERQGSDRDSVVAVNYERSGEESSSDGTPRLLPAETANGIQFAAASDIPNLPPVPNDSARSAEELVELGAEDLRNGRIEAGRRRLEAAVRRDGKNESIATTAALAALKQNQTSLSYELATHAFAGLPRSAGLARICGMSAYRQGRYGEAERFLRQSLNLDNSHALTYFLLGSALQRLDQPEAAERHLREAARLDARYATRK